MRNQQEKLSTDAVNANRVVVSCADYGQDKLSANSTKANRAVVDNQNEMSKSIKANRAVVDNQNKLSNSINENCSVVDNQNEMSKNIKLKARLSAVANEVDKGAVVADIGCDHGKLSAYLILNQIAKKVIAVDISKDSLSKTKLLVDKLHIQNLETRLGDGLSVIGKNEVDTVIIAGIGGMEIIKILSNAGSTFTKYILVPHSNARELREYAVDKFCITKDYLIKENNKYYNVIVLTEGISNLSEKELEFGKSLSSPLLKEKLLPEYEKYQKYLALAQNETEKQELAKKIALIKEIIE